MAIKTHINAEFGIAVQKLSGALTASNVVEAQQNLYENSVVYACCR